MIDEAYARATGALVSRGRLGACFGLERVERALQRMGQPHRRFRSIHVAGTNGKGSTSAMIASCLRQAGVRTGLYTSPHLCRFTERIQVDGQEVSREEVVQLTHEVLALDPNLTFFEAVTVMGFVHLARQAVELAVVETGLGGRLDATNVVLPAVSVLTRIDLDHTDVLGHRLSEVAREKAGIIKPRTPVVCAAACSEVERVVEHQCRALAAPLFRMGRALRLWHDDDDWHYEGPLWSLRLPPLSLAGEHQLENAALCVAALEQLRLQGVAVDLEAVRRGLTHTRWPGRMEWVQSGHSRYLLDGAHNPNGARALARALPPASRFTLIFGLLDQKDPRELLAPLAPHVERLILTRPRNPRAMDPSDLQRRLGATIQQPIQCAPTLPRALELAAQAADPVLVTGSLYLVGQAHELLLQEPTDPVQTADPVSISHKTVVPRTRHGVDSGP